MECEESSHDEEPFACSDDSSVDKTYEPSKHDANYISSSDLEEESPITTVVSKSVLELTKRRLFVNENIEDGDVSRLLYVVVYLFLVFNVCSRIVK